MSDDGYTQHAASSIFCQAEPEPNMSQYLRFDCVFYYVSNLERAIRFYSDILGFRLTSRDAVARFDLDGVLFELVLAENPAQLSGQGNARLTLAVDDIRQTADELASKGVAMTEVHAVSNGLLATFDDPDGNEIVLWQYT